jgi:hypothetical protein
VWTKRSCAALETKSADETTGVGRPNLKEMDEFDQGKAVTGKRENPGKGSTELLTETTQQVAKSDKKCPMDSISGLDFVHFVRKKVRH